MHFSVLKYFVEVARCGSIRKASESLYVASSAINRQILKLEDELGAELFDRVPNGMRLNAAGERLLKHVQATLHDFQVMRGELDALKGVRTGHVKLSTMDSMLNDFLPSTVEEFSEQFPAVTYTIMSAAPMDVPHHVFSAQADAGLTFIVRLPPGLHTVAQAALPVGVVMRPFDLPVLNQLKVGIVVPSQRQLPHVTQVFVDRMTRRLKQMEVAASAV